MLNKHFILLAIHLLFCASLGAQTNSNLYMIVGNDLQIVSTPEEIQEPSIVANKLETTPTNLAIKLYSRSNLGRELGHIGSYETIGLYLNGTIKDLEPFINLEGHWLGNLRWAGSAGLGVRYVDDKAKAVYGINGYYDYLYSEISTPQLSLGLEYSNKWFGIYGNYYWQTGREKPVGRSKTRYYDGGYFSTCVQTYELINGWDAEIGTGWNRWINLFPFRLYTGVGFYEYHYHKDDKIAFSGVRYRMEINYLDVGSIGIIGTHDHMFGNKLQGNIEINFPFIFGRPPRRQSVPLRPNTSCCWKTNF